MSPQPLESAAQEVLRRYGLRRGDYALHFLGNHGGFSGARLWRVEQSDRQFCLRAWPPNQRLPRHLVKVHQLMRLARAAGLRFVPEVWFTPGYMSWVEHAGRLWDLTEWMPGQADFRQDPTARRVEAATAALAQLHTAWSGGPHPRKPCPAIQRRLQIHREWDELVRAGWKPAFACGGADPVRPWAERAWRIVLQQSHRVPEMLEPWANKTFSLQPCLCDIWHDHVLFAGHEVSGIVDYGSTRVDHVAVDLARLLGSLVGDSTEQWQTGLRAYRRHRCLLADEEALAVVLDRTGTLLGAANWLKWLYHEKRDYEDREAVSRRLAELVERMPK